jgi:hypothetical protein
MKRFLFVILILLVACPAGGATYYVSNTATNGYQIGNDSNTTTQAKDKATPWLTWAGAKAKATANGDIIHVNGGDYPEDVISSTAILTWVADGTVNLGVAASTASAFLTNKDQTLNGISITKSAGYTITQSGQHTVTCSNCNLTVSGTALPHLYNGAYPNAAYNIESSTINISVNSGVFPYYILGYGQGLTLSGNTINFNSGRGLIFATTTAGQNPYRIVLSGNTYNIYGAPTNTADNNFITADGVSGVNGDISFMEEKLIIDDVDFNSESSIIKLKGYLDLVLTKIEIDASVSTDSYTLIQFYDVRNDTVASKITMKTKASGGYGLIVNATTIPNVLVFNNTLLGSLYYGVSPVDGYHGLYARGSDHVTFLKNYVEGTYHGIVYKGNTTLTGITSGGIFYNTTKDCTGSDIYVKGLSGVPIYNNTIYSSQSTVSDAGSAIRYGINDIALNSNPSPNGTIKNNIVNFTNETAYKTIQIETGCSTGLISDYNLLIQQKATVFASIGATVYNSFAEWQAAGYDPNSLNADPKFISATNYHLQSDSPARGAGVNVGLSNTNPPDIGAEPYQQYVPWKH